MSGRVVDFEIPTSDTDLARAFYGAAFGWEMVDMPGKQTVGDMGFAAYFKDPEGNSMGLWQDTGSARAQ